MTPFSFVDIYGNLPLREPSSLNVLEQHSTDEAKASYLRVLQSYLPIIFLFCY
jgi:hypothetical protein